MKKNILFLFILFTQILYGQLGHPEPGFIFEDDNLSRIDIQIEQDSFDQLIHLDNIFLDHEYPVNFILSRGLEADTFENVGFRLRGNVARLSGKKSFKISFNTFEKGRKYLGLEKLNLVSSSPDPCIVRAKLSHDMLRMAGIPAARSSHTLLFVNGEYYGLYIIIEPMDEEFILSRFGNNRGNHYKCLNAADLNYRGEDPNEYKFLFNVRRVYELKNNEARDDYSDLANFIDVLNNTPQDELACKLPEVLDVDACLKSMAFEVLIGHVDGPLYNKNNFHLYFDEVENRFRYLSYDLDATIGIDYLGVDWGIRDIYNWSHPTEERPLYTKLLSVPAWRDKYSFYMSGFIDSFFNIDYLEPILDSFKNANLEHFENDNFVGIDYNWKVTDYLAGYNHLINQHIRYGLKSYINTRVPAALDQLELNDVQPIFENVRVEILDESIYIECKIVDEQSENLEVDFVYTDGASTDNRLTMEYEGENIWSLELPIDELEEVYFQIVAKDDLNQSAYYPYCDYRYQRLVQQETPALFINEFMPHNVSGIYDEFDEHEDWVEIYNAEDSLVCLKGKYLSDDQDDLRRWPLPDTCIAPKQFLLLWLDDDEAQGRHHANFKLSKEGEQILLVDSDRNLNAIIDSLSYGPVLPNVSYGYQFDGEGEIEELAISTPRSTNNVQSSECDDIEFSCYPNPTQDQLNVCANTNLKKITLLDTDKRRVYTWHSVNRKITQLNLQALQLPPGLYFLRIASEGCELVERIVYHQ